ncbi:MAG: lipoyl(octanoyl) transferase LipB [Pseudomonadota bacterium]
MAGSARRPVEWRTSAAPVGYQQAVSEMEARVDAIRAGTADECVWLLDHPPLYTAGTSAAPADLLAPERFPVFKTGRGGQYTYHGPGQRIAYVMLDLTKRKKDVRAYVCALEDWIIATLARFGATGERRDGRVGVWVSRPDKGSGCEDKIAAIGVRVRRWVTFHGISFNVDPDLEHYSGIVPCGVSEHGVTSLADLGVSVSMDEVDQVLRAEFEKRFGSVQPADVTLSA